MYLVMTLAFKKNPKSSIGLEIRHQSAFSAFRALLPSADSNGFLAHHYCQQRAVTPYPESLNSKKKGAKLPLLSAESCNTLLDGHHCTQVSYKT